MNQRLLFWDDLARLILGMALAVVIFCAGWLMRGPFDTAHDIIDHEQDILLQVDIVLDAADSVEALLHGICNQLEASC